MSDDLIGVSSARARRVSRVSSSSSRTGNFSTARCTPVAHSVNGFRLHQTAMYLESQTHFGDIPGPRKGSAGVFLDSAQPVAHGVRVTDKYLSRTAHRRIVVQPHPKRFKKHLAVRVEKIAKTVQQGADRLDHHLRRADCSGGQD